MIETKTNYNDLSDSERFCMETYLHAMHSFTSIEWKRDHHSWMIHSTSIPSCPSSVMKAYINEAYHYKDTLVLLPFRNTDQVDQMILHMFPLPLPEWSLDPDVGVVAPCTMDSFVDYYTSSQMSLHYHLHYHREEGAVLCPHDFALAWNLASLQDSKEEEKPVGLYEANWSHPSISDMSGFLNDRMANHPICLHIGDQHHRLYMVIRGLPDHVERMFQNGRVLLYVNSFQQYMEVMKRFYSSAFTKQKREEYEMKSVLESDLEKVKHLDIGWYRVGSKVHIIFPRTSYQHVYAVLHPQGNWDSSLQPKKTFRL